MRILFFEKATTPLGLSWHLGDIRQGLWWRRGPWLLLETQQRPRLRPGPHGQVCSGKPAWLVAEGTGCWRSARGSARSSLASLGSSETPKDTKQQDTAVQFAGGIFGGGAGIRRRSPLVGFSGALIPDFVTLPIVAPGAPRSLVSISGTGSVPRGRADLCGPAARRPGPAPAQVSFGQQRTVPKWFLGWAKANERHGNTEIRETPKCGWRS